MVCRDAMRIGETQCIASLPAAKMHIGAAEKHIVAVTVPLVAVTVPLVAVAVPLVAVTVPLGAAKVFEVVEGSVQVAASHGTVL